MTFPRSILIAALALIWTTAALAQTGPALPAAYTTANFYDLGGRLTGVIDPNPGDVSYRSTLPREIRTPLPAGTSRRSTRERSRAGRLQVCSQRSGRASALTRKRLSLTTRWAGSSLKSSGADGNPYALTQYSYDSVGRQQCAATRMNPAVYGSLPASACTLGAAGSYGPDRITYTTYDATDRPVTIQHGYGTSLAETYAAYTYTPNHLQHTIKDANSNLTTLSYDGLDRLSETQFPSKTTVNTSSTTDFELYTYDANNNRKTLVTRDSQTITYNYDNLNRLTSKLWPSPWGVSVYYGYDLRNLQLCANSSSACTVVNSIASVASDGVTTTYDGFSRVNSEAVNLSGTALTMSYQYDADDNRTQVKYPDNNYIQYNFDGLDRLTQLLENGSASAVLTLYSYDTAGRVQQMTRGGGVTTTAFGYDPVSRLNSSLILSQRRQIMFHLRRLLTIRAISSPASLSRTPSTIRCCHRVARRVIHPMASTSTQPWAARPSRGIREAILPLMASTTYSYDLENRLTGARASTMRR